MELNERLAKIQIELKVPKTRPNDFGGYMYRNLEDIMDSVKPLLNGLTLTFSDEVKSIGDQLYVESTATLSDGNNSIKTKAFAREVMDKKKYDSSQLTGSASSYARKYAANGMFCIDDVKDSDTINSASSENTQPSQNVVCETKWYNDFDKQKATMVEKIKSGKQTPQGIIDALKNKGFAISKATQDKIKALGE